MGRWVINVDCVFAAALSTPLQIILTALTVFPSSTLCFYYDDMIVTNIFCIYRSDHQSFNQVRRLNLRETALICVPLQV